MNTETKQMQDLMRKLRALKAKAEDRSVTEEESLAYAAKVAELLAQHGLEMAQLNVAEQPAEEAIIHEDYASNWNAGPVRRVLAIAVCNLYNVKPLIRSAKNQPWTLIGRPHNIVMVKEMMAYLTKTVVRLATEYDRKHRGGMADFRRGCFKRIAERVADMYWETARKERAQYTASGNPGNLPALYATEANLMQAYRERMFPDVGTLKPQRVKQGHHAMAGRAAGDTVSLHRQVAGNGTTAHLLGNGNKGAK